MFPIIPTFQLTETTPLVQDVFEDWETDGALFVKMAELNNALPWHEYDPILLDIEYIANRSGIKYVAPIVKRYLDDDGKLTSVGLTIIARILLAKYLNNWTRLWATNVVEYSPIHNYDMTEERNLVKGASSAEYRSSVETHTGTDTLSHGKAVTTVTSTTDNSDDSIYGLNSSAPSPSDKNVSSGSVNSTDTASGSDVTTKNLSDTDSENVNRADAGEEAETLHRVGNIGVTTNQQMLNAEREVWLWNFFDSIYKDIDREITLAVFDPCR